MCSRWELITHAASETLKWLDITRYFITFPISKELYVFLKEWRTRLYQALFIYKKLAADDDAKLKQLGLVKNLTFSYKRAYFNGKHFRENIMTTCYFCFGLLN